jgi:DNA (cytosine-5)-methyltransferase 1
LPIKTYGSLFAGVGGIDLALDSVELQCKFQVEIDENCQQTLSHHWPNVPKYTDIKTVSGYDLPPVDMITFGSPCQDLSTAGKRAGLEGERSGLFYEAVRIIKEMRDKTNGQYPKISIWENVVGALSSNGGADFGEVLHEMDEAGACFSEWAVLDARYFGVPQRRRRVYLISVYDPTIASRCPSKILSVNEINRGNSKKIFKQWQKNTQKTIDSPAGNNEEEHLTVDIVGPLQARDYKGVGNQYVQENKLVVELTSSLVPNIRRLTPLEYERLMGWPDNHTLNRADGKTNADSTRYKMCGNGVASPVIKWIANQIKEL